MVRIKYKNCHVILPKCLIYKGTTFFFKLGQLNYVKTHRGGFRQIQVNNELCKIHQKNQKLIE